MSYFLTKKRHKTITEKGDEILYNPKKKLSEIINYFSKQILINEQLQNATPGLYTWILRESGNIYASKTISKQEIGTLHVNLDMLTSADTSNIYAAGELEIVKDDYNTPVTIIFNLLSGSYMVKKFKGISNINTLRNEIITNVQQVLINYGIASQFLECSGIHCTPEEEIGGMNLIETANIRTSNNNIAILNTMFNRDIGGAKISKRRRMTQKKQRKQKKQKKQRKQRKHHGLRDKVNIL